MILLAIAPLILCQQPHIEGLKPEETAVWIAEPAPVLQWGRLLDSNGEPLAGVRIERWIENGVEPTRIGRLTAVARSGADGSFFLGAGPSSQGGDKYVFRGPSGASWFEDSMWGEEHTIGDGDPFGIRFLSVDGRPIAGATVRSRGTCAHGPPAMLETSDHLGRVRLEGMPIYTHQPELYAKAPGYAYTLDRGSRMDGVHERDGYADFYLPRSRSTRIQLLDHDGAPVSVRRVAVGVTPSQQYLWTDDYGWLQIDSLPSDSAPWVHLRYCDSEGDEYIADIEVFSDDEPLIVRPMSGRFGYDEGDRAELAQVELTCEEDEPEPRVQIFHREGWIASGIGEHVLPPGKARLVVGQLFSAYDEEVRKLELTSGTQRYVLEPQRSRHVSLQFGATEEWWELYAEVGGQSRAYDIKKPGDEPFERLYLPNDQSATLLLLGSRGSVLRMRVSAGTGDLALSVDDSWEQLRKPVSTTEERKVLWLSAVDSQGRRIEEAEIKVRTVSSWNQSRERLPGEFLVPAGERLFITAKANGHTSAEIVLGEPDLKAIANAGEEGHRIQFELAAQCAVEVLGGKGGFCAGLPFDTMPAKDVPYEEQDDETKLVWRGAAGPAHLRLELADGRWIGAEIELAPGEHRVLRVHN